MELLQPGRRGSAALPFGQSCLLLEGGPLPRFGGKAAGTHVLELSADFTPAGVSGRKSGRRAPPLMLTEKLVPKTTLQHMTQAWLTSPHTHP